MKRLIICAAAALVLVACGEKKGRNSDIITTDYVKPEPTAPIAMGEVSELTGVEWVAGKQYTVSMTRMPADSLPTVTNENGQQYVDNAIRLRVLRPDDSAVFDRLLTKSTFVSWLDQEYRRKALLEGISKPRVEGADLVFTVWLNYPEAGDDEAVELKLTISPSGELAIQHYSENDRDDLNMRDHE